ncbi:sugar phosphate isomerase/epimerase family protein [Paenibacillus agaridevorans]|uniref:sugar phosphate isomerase/epimerase family protein n=1 Tax=Paenibacillus agaridevorans TaxID=171404 RepID=UPI001BE4291F|nr:sugar phosphate isomerase/epimerase [Paenibacillus agaridevorans]
MKLGLSTYSLLKALRAGQMTIEEVIRWAAEQGAEHIELVPVGFDWGNDLKSADTLRTYAEQAGIELSNYTVSANFITEAEEQYKAEIERVCRQVDIAHRLGVKRMRHDVAKRPVAESSIMRFQQDLDKLAAACRIVADYAQQYGIVTSVENHGYHMQASERVQMLLHAVDRPNFRMTLDIGNFLVVDENPVAAVQKMIGYASVIHLKDFYVRPAHRNPGQGWMRSASGNYLRGSIFGQGDVHTREIIRLIKASGYDGYLSLEFEGMEECRLGAQIGLANAQRLWDEAEAARDK